MALLHACRLLPLLSLFGLYACNGDVNRTGSSGDGDSDESGSDSSEQPGDTGAEPLGSGGTTAAVGGTDVGGGIAVGTGGMQGPPVDVPSTGGATLTSEDIGLWCPTGDDWDSLFEDVSENLGGAPTDSDCPVLSSISYSNSSCSVEFASLEPVFLRETGACCYEIDAAHCN